MAAELGDRFADAAAPPRKAPGRVESGGPPHGLALDRFLRLLRRLPVPTLCELLDDLRVEGGQVVRLAARDEAGIDDDLLINPRRSRVAEIGLEARPRGHLPALDDAGLDQRPRAVADDADRLAGCREVPKEADDVFIGAELVGIGNAARKPEPVVVVDLRLLGRLVGRERVALVE